MTAHDNEPFDRERIWRGIQRGQSVRRRQRRLLKSIMTAAAAGIVWLSVSPGVDSSEVVTIAGDSALRAAVAELETSVRARWASMESVDQVRLETDLAVIDSVIMELRHHNSRSSAELALISEQTDQALEMKAHVLRDAVAHITPAQRN